VIGEVKLAAERAWEYNRVSYTYRGGVPIEAFVSSPIALVLSDFGAAIGVIGERAIDEQNRLETMAVVNAAEVRSVIELEEWVAVLQ
jgi:hypothetical protein